MRYAMKYIIYLAVAALVLWSVWYVAKTVRRQMKGDCGCGKGAGCENCGAGRCGKKR